MDLPWKTGRVVSEAYPCCWSQRRLRSLQVCKDVRLVYKRTSIRSQEVQSPPRSSEALTTRCLLQGGIPPCNESLRVTWGGIPPQGEVLFGRLLLGGILPRRQSVPMIIARVVCHPGDQKRQEEFPRRFKDVYSSSGPEIHCCRMLRKQTRSFVPYVNKRLTLKRADGRL